MKLFVATLIVLVGVALAQDKITTKYDGVNLDEILKSERLLNNYYKCLMETGKCTPDGNELKRRLPDALKNNCSGCKFNDKIYTHTHTFSNMACLILEFIGSEKQKDGTEKVIRYLIDNKKSQWDDLQKKYDPNNVYYMKYKDEAKAKGIDV